MPIYEYTCDVCGYEDDYMIPFTDDTVPCCPDCRLEMRKRFPSFTIHMFPDYTQRKHHGIGERVKSKQDLKDKMKIKAEQYEARVGIPIEYEMP